MSAKSRVHIIRDCPTPGCTMKTETLYEHDYSLTRHPYADEVWASINRLCVNCQSEQQSDEVEGHPA